MSRFEIRAKDGMGRTGVYSTNHGDLNTPLLMPVIHPGKSVIPPRELVDKYGFQMVITNSYIIRSHDRFREKAVAEGVHSLLDIDVPIMTDSGTFQMYVHGLPDEEINPLEIVEFQKSIGTDIGTILDVFSDPDVGRKKVEDDVQLSLERARASVGSKGEMLLAGTVQGGIYPDLREESAKGLAELDFDVHPIGGAVPLMERYRYADIVRATLAAKKYLPPNRPVHLFGCGHPMFFAQAALLGCDFFDSASYAKFAESGRMMLPTGTVHLKDLRELPCGCPVCSSHTAGDLTALSKEERDVYLMRHNLYVIAAEMRRVRQAISDGKLLELCAVRARGHPNLYEALQVYLDHFEQIEEADPVGNASSIFYTGPETAKHPVTKRYFKRVLARYPYRQTRNLILVPSLGDRPFGNTAPTIINSVKRLAPRNALLAFVTPIGIVPWELEHVHPAQQCIFPSTIDQATLGVARGRLIEFLDATRAEEIFWFNRESPTNVFAESLSGDSLKRLDKASEILEMLGGFAEERLGWTSRKLRALLAYQWGIRDISKASFSEMMMKVSKATGKIRHVKKQNEILFTLVPTTGLLTPTYEGGQALRGWGIGRDYIVTMDNDAAEFVVKGKSALAKFVKDASPNLRAGEDVLLVDELGELLAVGRANLSGNEMLSFSRGVAVVTRHPRKH